MQPHEYNILPRDGEAWYYRGFFSEEERQRFYDSLLTSIQWEQKQVMLFGRLINEPRLSAWYGDEGLDYTYSGIVHKPLSWTPELLEIKAEVEVEAKVVYNSVLLNFYRDGIDSMGWHQDDEKELGLNPIIGSVSFGATRKFRFKHAGMKKLTIEIELENGSLLLMKGETQHHWYHCIPKTRRPVGPRINLTFRIIL